MVALRVVLNFDSWGVIEPLASAFSPKFSRYGVSLALERACSESSEKGW